jgi:Disulphide bond corrector protein DsbC/AhpC/TSA family
LRGFATTHGITYPLLSDEGSRTMRGLGLINDRVQEDHAVYGIQPNPRHVDLPYPGAFVLDRDGVVTQKRFYESYRERDTGTGLIAQAFGIVAEPSAPVVATNGPVTVRAWLDSPTYVFFQRVMLTVEVSTAAGYHVYSQPGRDGLTPLSIEIDALDGLQVGPALWPSPRRVTVPNGDEGQGVYQGIVRGRLPLTFAAAPGRGDRMVRLTVRYQACDGASRLAPSAVQLRLPVREAALVGRSLPGPASTT